MTEKIDRDQQKKLLDILEKAAWIRQENGHITNLKDLSKEENYLSKEVYDQIINMFNVENVADWIDAGIPSEQVEIVKSFLSWYAKLSIAGIYDDDGAAICNDCLPEKTWEWSSLNKHEWIMRREVGMFFCSVCQREIEID